MFLVGKANIFFSKLIADSLIFAYHATQENLLKRKKEISLYGYLTS